MGSDAVIAHAKFDAAKSSLRVPVALVTIHLSKKIESMVQRSAVDHVEMHTPYGCEHQALASVQGASPTCFLLLALIDFLKPYSGANPSEVIFIHGLKLSSGL